MTAAKPAVAPVVKPTDGSPLVRHIYHRCQVDDPKFARCGHKSGPITRIAFDPNLPHLCKVCLDLREYPCERCGE